ncbi:Crp/Fnr family transcriptional regulator [Paenibacillus sp. y28]|uniref:Crp/Fnr family transcriptional regulator n=1 Tax=Paenibacillus sp. y28 TaxID=3129110 RepID=UPI0030163238
MMKRFGGRGEDAAPEGMHQGQTAYDAGQIISHFFREAGQLRSYRKHEFIFREEDEAAEAYYVQSGLVKISQSAQEGHHITLFLRHEGEAFGTAEVLADRRRQRYARCISDCEIVSIPTDSFVRLVQSQPEVLYAFAVTGAQRLLATQQAVEALISRPVAWRLANFLLQFGIEAEDGVHVQLHVSHEEISGIIGCSRQTVTETLNKWRDQGLIHYEKKHVVLFNPRLLY